MGAPDSRGDENAILRHIRFDRALKSRRWRPVRQGPQHHECSRWAIRYCQGERVWCRRSNKCAHEYQNDRAKSLRFPSAICLREIYTISRRANHQSGWSNRHDGSNALSRGAGRWPGEFLSPQMNKSQVRPFSIATNGGSARAETIAVFFSRGRMLAIMEIYEQNTGSVNTNRCQKALFIKIIVENTASLAYIRCHE